MAKEYCSSFFEAMSPANLQLNLGQYFPTPPVVVKTSGVNLSCSTSSTRILALLLVLMYSIDLRFHVPVRVGTRVTNPHVKECRTLALPEPTGINVYLPRIRRSIGSSTQLCTTPKIIGAKRLEKSDLCFH